MLAVVVPKVVQNNRDDCDKPQQKNIQMMSFQEVTDDLKSRTDAQVALAQVVQQHVPKDSRQRHVDAETIRTKGADTIDAFK